MTRLLVVDDEAIITMQLEERLSTMGYSVAGMAASGEEAVEKAKRFRPDLVLMDIVMPGKLNGIEAAKIITEELDIPVVFVTAYADDNIIQTAKSIQPYGYIVKPFNELELKAAIEIALFRKATEQQGRKLRKTAPEIIEREGQEKPEYLDLPSIQTVLLRDIFNDIILFLYTNQTPKEPVFKFVLEEAIKKRERVFYSYYHSTLSKYFQKEILNKELFTRRIRSDELYTLLPLLETCTESLQGAIGTAPLQLLLDFSDTREYQEIIAITGLLLSRKEMGVPISGMIAMDIGNLDHDRIESLAGGFRKIIIASGRETMFSFAQNSFPTGSVSVVPQSTIDDVVRKLLEPVVLSLLQRPISGYEIVHEIHDRYNVLIPQARVYAILYNLEKQGCLEIRISGKSKLYFPTKKGRGYIDQRLNDFTYVLQHILVGNPGKIMSGNRRKDE